MASSQDALTPEELKALDEDIDDGTSNPSSENKGFPGIDFPVAMNSSNPDSEDNADSVEMSEDDKAQEQKNIQLLLDVFVQVTVELGRAQHDIKYILGLGEGSIIELDKPASEPVELLVNNQLVAKGEVVVIDENFGVRITKIIDPKERLMRITG